MSAQICQRWRERRDSYRPARETIVRSQFDIASIKSDSIARAFVEQHHYSASYPAARERFGLYRFGALVGVAVFSHPTNDRCLTGTFTNIARLTGVELGRLVLLDEIAANAESYFVARCFEQLRVAGYRGVVSFSDPVARVSLDGRVVMPGHVGTVYQALNARYLGRSDASVLRLLPDGTVLNRRTIQKLRAAEKGWLAAVAQLESFGAPPLDRHTDDVERRAWVRVAVALCTTPLKHLGNHKYAWALDRRVRIPAPATSYPKVAA